jgi:hypothetical protein
VFGSPLPRQSFRGNTFIFLQGINIYHAAYKTIVYIWLAGIFWLAWSLSPFSGAWSRPQRLDKISLHPSNIARYGQKTAISGQTQELELSQGNYSFSILSRNSAKC